MGASSSYIDWTDCELVACVPGRVSGRPVVRCFIKGAAPAVMSHATSALSDGRSVPWDPALAERAKVEMERMEAEGRRVMAAAQRDIDPAEFDLGIATSIRGTFLGMKFQIPAILRSGGGAIVNMASIAGLNGTANLAAYVAGKAGIIGLTKVAALDYADQGVRVNVVAPGPILTYHLEAAGPEAQRLAGLSTPMRRTGSVA